MTVFIEVFLSLILPGIVFLLGENNKSRGAQFLQKRGYDPKNPVHRERFIRARHTGAIAYAIVAMLLLFMSGRINRLEDGIGLGAVWFFFARVAFEVVHNWSFKLQQFGKMDSDSVLFVRDTEFVKRPQPLTVDDGNMGTAQVHLAEANGLADPEGLSLGERGAQR